MPTANTYPAIAASDDITADLLSSMLPRFIVKPSATVRTSTTTLANDPDLSMTLEANATYFVEFHLYYLAINAEKFKTAWTVPSGVTGSRAVIGLGSTATDSNADNTTSRHGTHNFATAIGYGTRDNAAAGCYAIETAVITTTSSGTIALQWAQSTSGSTGTTLNVNSLMRVTRLA